MWLHGMWIEDIERKTYLLAESEADTGAGDSSGDDGKSGDKQADVTKTFHDYRTATDKTIMTLRKEITDLKKSGEGVKSLEAKLAAFESRLSSSSEKIDEKTQDPQDGKEEKALLPTIDTETQKLIKDLQKKVADQEKTLGEERKARVDAEQRRSFSERDRELLTALTEVKALHMERSRRMHVEDIVQDDDGHWMYKDGETLITIAEGVEKYQPKEMREARTRRGGSGGDSPEKTDTSTVKQLSDQAIALGIAARKSSGRDSVVMDYQRARRLAVQAGADDQLIVKAVTAASVA